LHLSLISSRLPNSSEYLRKSLAIYHSESQYFDTRAAICRGARTLALALEPGDESTALLQRAWDLRKELTGVQGSMEDQDEDYSALLFYWSR
jgi:hypothetical protein